jgi:transcriptional regulator GlxA family with amidase domain
MVCTGAFLLGAAGLLQGAPAPTHWDSRSFLAQVGATYVPERVVRHGRVITAAGVSAGIDMALALAAEIAGAEWAQAAQLALEYDPEYRGDGRRGDGRAVRGRLRPALPADVSRRT